MNDLTFVLCIENNAIRAQALLLCESIRQFGGGHRAARILAVSPRPGLGVDDDTRRQLEAMRVEYVEAPLNLECPHYGSANRVFAAAWAEQRAQSEWIAVLDSDTVFLDELDLPAGADVAARPVDVKGSATCGPGDPFEDYWAQLAALEGLSLDALPFLQTTVSNERVRAAYNGGLIVARRRAAVLAGWADLFSRSLSLGLKPWRGSNMNVFASTGFVGQAASEYWGSNQAAAALAIWRRTSQVVLYPASYNVPLHSIVELPEFAARPRPAPIVHVHYHWLFAEPHHEIALGALARLGVPADRLAWLAARLPLR